MRNRSALVFTFLLLGVLVIPFSVPRAAQQESGQPAAAAPAVFKSITPTEAKKMIDEKKNIALLDVRTEQELKEGAIAGSKLVPLWSVFKNQLSLSHETPVLLICAVGGRSYAAGQMMYRYGYREVYNLSGGIDAWKKAGLPLVY